MQQRQIEQILSRVSKPARYTGNELNIIRKNWDEADIKMAFAFPDVYEIGMSHLGGKILYGLVNETTHHLLERVFAPWPDFEIELRQAGLPLYSLENSRPLGDFDIIGFSLQYELSITNCLNMLDICGIPLQNAQRAERDPFVMGGGPLCFNPEPYADFFDLFIVGEAEEVLPKVLDNLAATRGLDRISRLKSLARFDGVYIPGFYDVDYNCDGTIKNYKRKVDQAPAFVSKAVVADLDEAYFPEKPILPYISIIHDRASLEIMRGCQRACRFCQAGSIYRPLRERSPHILAKQAQAQLAATGYEEISLASLSSLDYSNIGELVSELVGCYGNEGIGISLPSLRVDAVSVDIANEIQKVRKTTLTFAPEAGSQRLRDIINKNVSEDDILAAARAAFSSGWLSLKLYFMLGLPGETIEDLDSTIELLRKIAAVAKQHCPRRFEIRASFSFFVPKAHTPFQWAAQNRMEEFLDKKEYLNRTKIKNVKMSFHDARTSMLEGVIARGDRRIGSVILKAWEYGCKFDGWSEYFRFDLWEKAMAECGIDPGFYIYRPRSYDEALPWDIISTGLEKAYLIEENDKSESGVLTPDCHLESCVDCGVCPNLGVNLQVKKEADKC